MSAGAPLVMQQSRRHVPAIVDLADNGVVTQPQAVEEFLAELRRPVDLLNAAQGDAGRVDRNQEHRQAVMLGDRPVGASH